MHVYFSKTFTATANGARIKEVSCEKCGSVYFYKLTRMGTGRGEAPYMLFQGAARKRAEKGAAKDLERRLQRDVELVPCPSCQRVNESAIRAYRKGKYRGYLPVCIFILFVGGLLDFIFYLARDPFRPDFSGIKVVTVVACAIVGLTLSLQFFLRRRISPNILTPGGRPSIPIGTPPALVKDPKTQEYVRAAGDGLEIPESAEWAVFRAGGLTFEPFCCECLDAATATFTLPITLSSPLGVPMCGPCLGRLKRKFWMGALVLVPGSFLITLLVVQLIPGMDDFGRVAMAIVGALVISIFGMVVILRRLPPYRLRNVDVGRALFKIGFRNPAYTAILIRRLAEKEVVS